MGTDVKTINMNVIKQYQSDFTSEQSLFQNKTYSSFKNGYINSCSDPYVQVMAQKLNVMYDDIQNSYTKIGQWWNNYISQYESIDKQLLNQNSDLSSVNGSNILNPNGLNNLTMTFDSKTPSNLNNKKKLSATGLTDNIINILIPKELQSEFKENLTEKKQMREENPQLSDTIDMYIEYQAKEGNHYCKSFDDYKKLYEKCLQDSEFKSTLVKYNKEKVKEEAALAALEQASSLGNSDALYYLAGGLSLVSSGIDRSVGGMLSFCYSGFSFIMKSGSKGLSLIGADNLADKVDNYANEFATEAETAVDYFFYNNDVTEFAGNYKQDFANEAKTALGEKGELVANCISGLCEGAGSLMVNFTLMEAFGGIANGLGFAANSDILIAGISMKTSTLFGLFSGVMNGGGNAYHDAVMHNITTPTGVDENGNYVYANALDNAFKAELISGAWSGLTYAIGNKYGSDTNGILNIFIDTAQGAGDQIFQPIIDMQYKKSYYDENGNLVSLDEKNLDEKYKILFDENGGWDSVLQNAVVSGANSLVTSKIPPRDNIPTLDDKQKIDINESDIKLKNKLSDKEMNSQYNYKKEANSVDKKINGINKKSNDYVDDFKNKFTKPIDFADDYYNETNYRSAQKKIDNYIIFTLKKHGLYTPENFNTFKSNLETGKFDSSNISREVRSDYLTTNKYMAEFESKYKGMVDEQKYKEEVLYKKKNQWDSEVNKVIESSPKGIELNHGYQLQEVVDDVFGDKFCGVPYARELNNIGYMPEYTGKYIDDLFNNGNNYDIYVYKTNSRNLSDIYSKGLSSNDITYTSNPAEVTKILKMDCGNENNVDGALILKIPKGMDKKTVFVSYGNRTVVDPKYIDSFIGVDKNRNVGNVEFKQSKLGIENNGYTYESKSQQQNKTEIDYRKSYYQKEAYCAERKIDEYIKYTLEKQGVYTPENFINLKRKIMTGELDSSNVSYEVRSQFESWYKYRNDCLNIVNESDSNIKNKFGSNKVNPKELENPSISFEPNIKNLKSIIKENMPNNLSSIEKAYYIYRKLNKEIGYSWIYWKYATDPMLKKSKSPLTRKNFENIVYNKRVDIENYNYDETIVCSTWAQMYGDFLKSEGIDYKILGKTHKYITFEADGKYYYADAFEGLKGGYNDVFMNQVGGGTSHFFQISKEQYDNNVSYKNYEDDSYDFVLHANSPRVSEIKNMDYKLGFDNTEINELFNVKREVNKMTTNDQINNFFNLNAERAMDIFEKELAPRLKNMDYAEATTLYLYFINLRPYIVDEIFFNESTGEFCKVYTLPSGKEYVHFGKGRFYELEGDAEEYLKNYNFRYDEGE